jgi:hypothetical protein
LLLGAVCTAPLVALGIIANTCFERIAAEQVSPDGAYVALDVYEGCGGAAGSSRRFVRLQRLADQPRERAETILSSGTGRTRVLLSWEDNRTLVVTYVRSDMESISTRREDRLGDVRIIYRPGP